MSLGGGGLTCTICTKTSYPAETILFDQRPFHAECFKCSTCSKKMEAFGAAQYEGTIYCKFCFDKGGFARKQAAVKWVPKSGGSSASSTGPKLGGGGLTCTSCGKTAYPGECSQYDGKPYHVSCLRCSECSKECTMSNLAQYEGKLFCLRCFEKGGYARKQASVKFVAKTGAGTTQARFAGLGGGGQKCYTCQNTVYPAETILFEQRPYHAKCFRCLNCSKEMTVNQAEHKGDKVYCQKCFVSLGLHLATLDPPGTAKDKKTTPAPTTTTSAPVTTTVTSTPTTTSSEPEPEPEPTQTEAPAETSPQASSGGLSAEEEIAALKQKLQEQEIALLKQKLKEAEAKLG